MRGRSRFVTELDVDQHDIWPKLLLESQRFGARRRNPDNRHTFTLERIVKGASVIDPALVQELVAARGARDPLDVLSPREREVLALMAEGRSNAGIAHTLWITESTVEKHVRAILRKLRLPAGEDDQRRVLAVVTYLNAR